MDKSKKAVKRRKFLQNVACFSVVACSSSAIVAGVTCSILYSKLEPVERQYFSLVLDAGSGQFENGNHAVSFDIQLKTTWKEIQEQQITPSPTYVGHGFTGWVINGEAIPDDYVFLEDTVVNATYSVNKIALSFANQPELDVGVDDVILPKTMTGIRYGMNWSDIKKSAGAQLYPDISERLSKDKDLVFADYYVDHDHNPKTPKIRIADSYVFDGDTELEAHYDAKIKFQDNLIADKPFFHFDYVDATFPIGTIWGDVNTSPSAEARKKYEPWTTNEAQKAGKMFDYYQEKGETIEPTYEITHPTTFDAKPKDIEPKTFEEDLWATFLKFIEGKSLQDLFDEKSAYYHDWLDSVDRQQNPDYYKIEKTFVGLKRTLVVNGYEFTLRVVDENENWSEENDWHFLFEFESVIYIPMPFNSIDTETQYQNQYINSSLDYNLRNTIFEWFPEQLQDYWNENIHPNRHYPVDCWSVNNGEIETVNRHVFAPSAKELGFDKFPDYGQDVKEEGEILPFYANIKKNEEEGKAEEITAKFRQKKFVDGTELHHVYWVRTPDITTTIYAWGVNKQGGLGNAAVGSTYAEPYAAIEDILYISPIIAI